MPEDLPDHMPEDMPDRMPNRMSEDMSDRMPEDLPVRKCINVMVGITRSKVIFIEHQKITDFIFFELPCWGSIRHFETHPKIKNRWRKKWCINMAQHLVVLFLPPKMVMVPICICKIYIICIYLYIYASSLYIIYVYVCIYVCSMCMCKCIHMCLCMSVYPSPPYHMGRGREFPW